MSRPLKVRLGMEGYVEIAARLRQPCTIKDLQNEGLVANSNSYRLVPSMWAMGLVHISGWDLTPGRRTMPLWKWGQGDDAPVPERRGINGIRPVYVKPPKKPERASPEIIAFASLLSAIEVRVTRAQIEALTGLNWQTVARALRALMRHKMAHRPGFMPPKSQGGQPAALYLIGPGTNAVFQALPKQERRKQRRRQLRQASPVNMMVATLTSAPIQLRSAA